MQLWHYGLGFSLALGVGVGVGGGCAAGGKNNVTSTGTGGSGSGSTSGTGGGLLTTGSTSGSGPAGSTGVGGGLGACSKFSAEAKQAPAAMLIVQDRSASMSQQNKWGTSTLAVVQAIDEDVFDTMSLGMLVFPSASYVTSPQCLVQAFGPTTVACGIDVNPSVAVASAGTAKSTAAMGVRHDVFQFMAGHSPEINDPSDASPIYDALKAAYAQLQAVPATIQERMLVLITDGGGSCASLSNPVRPGYFDGACNDWEHPDSINQLITTARTDPNTPINTFIVGVPGSNSHANDSPFPYAPAPYSMLLALSTYAVSGSPTTIDPNCDKNLAFTQNGADPAHPCHIDLSNNANFNAGALANTIATLRGKALGCVYDLPPPPMGQTINKSEVNVVVTINGMPYTIPKRTSSSDMCLTDPCWDYDAQGKVNLIGIACSTVSTSASAKVEIYVGCATILK
jgi:hypothetical protein